MISRLGIFNMIGSTIRTSILAVFVSTFCFVQANANPLNMDWTGFYFGGHLGGGSADFDISRGSLSAPGTPGSELDADGFLAGFLLGANFQTGNIVYGFEGDISFGGVDQTNPVFTLPSMDVEVVGTIRGRVGVIHDRWLFFGTAGIGFASVEATERGAFSDDNVHVGFVIGAGAEYAWHENLVARAEIMAGFYGDETYLFQVPGAVHSHDIDLTTVVGRVALIWHFDEHPIYGN